jgi:hypothetical protein
MRAMRALSRVGANSVVTVSAFPSYLAVDATHVYFLAAGTQILRAPR